LRLSEAADLLGVSLNTLRRWSDSGRLACYRSPGGHRRYRRTDVDTLLRRQSSERAPDAGARFPAAAPAPDAESHTASVRPALTTLAQAVAEGIGVTACVVAASDGDGRLRVVASHASTEGHLTPPPGEVLTRESAPVADEVVHTRRRVLIADVGNTIVITPTEIAACRERGEAAVLALPLALKGQLFGVMQLVEHRAPRAFTGANVAFAEFVARQATGIIASAVAGDAAPARDQAPFTGPDDGAAPNAAATAVRAREGPASGVQATLRALAGRLCRRLDGVACDVLRAGPTPDVMTRVLVVRPGRSPAPFIEATYRIAELPGAESAVRDGTVSSVDLPPRDEDDRVAWHGVPGARHVLVAPLRLGDRQHGLLRVFSATPGRAYAEEELDLVEASAADAALALTVVEEDRDLTTQAAGLDVRLGRASSPSAGADIRTYLRAFDLLVRALSPEVDATVYEASRGMLHRLGALADDRPDGSPLAADVDVQAVLADGRSRLVARDTAFAFLSPLQEGARTVGLLELESPSDEALKTAAAALEPATQLLASTLAAQQTADVLQRRVHDLETVVQAGIEDAARLSTDEVLQSVIQRLSELTRTPVADVYAVEGGTLRALISYDTGRVDPEWEGVAIPIARYPCSLRAVETGKVAIATSLDDEILGENGRFSLERWGYQSQLSMPLIAGGRVIGLVELSDYVPRDFAEDLELIHGLCRVAAQALENAQLFEQVERRSRILNELVEIGTFASTCRDSDTVLRHVAERLLRTLDAANCDIYQMSDEGLRCVASFDRSGFDEEAVGRLLDVATYPTLTRAVTTGQVLVVSGPDDPQLTERERDVYREYGFNSEVCVPLIVNDGLFGLIDIYDTRPRHYSEYLAFLRSLGMSLAGAFASTLLFERLEHRTRVLREIVELGELAAQGGELPELLTTIAGRLRTFLDVADCDIYVLDGDELHCVASVDERGPDEKAVGISVKVSRFPVIELAIRTREPMVVPSLDDPRVTDDERVNYAEWGFQSLVSIPLSSGEQVLGVIDVFDTRKRDYGAYLDFLRTVGQIVAGAIRNARLLSQLTARNRELAELVDLGHLRVVAGGVVPLLREITRRVSEVVGAAGSQVFAADEDGYRSVYTWEDGQPSLEGSGHLLDLERFPTTRRALEERNILVVESPGQEGLSDTERDHYARSGWGSDILVPLLAEDRLVGLLEVYDRRARDYREHRDFLRRAGQIVAAALENAQLVERLEHANVQLGHLVEAGLEFGSTLETKVVLRSVARRLCAAAKATACDIYAVEGDTLRCLTSIVNDGEDLTFTGTVYELDLFDGVRDVLAQGRPLAVRDMVDDERISAFEREENLRFGHRAKVELPLVAGGGTVGLVSIYDEQPRDFGDLELLQSLAQVAANAIANARLYDALEGSAARVALVGDVSFELSSSLDLGEVLQSTAHRLCALADMPCCDVYKLDAGDRLVCVVSLVEGETDGSWQGRAFPLARWSALSAAVERRMPLVIASADDPLLNDEERALMREFGETAEVVFPLISKGVVIGVLELLETRGPRHFDEEQIDTIAAVCRVAALAIDNADLVKDLQLRNRETELLNEIARATTTLDLPAVAAGAVEELRSLAPVDSAALLLLDGDALETAYASGSLRAGGGDAATARDVVSDIRRERVVVVDPRVDPRPGVLHDGAGAHGAIAMIAIPTGDGLNGVLSLGVRDPRGLDGLDRHLLERVGAQLAPAINNARLYADIQRLHLGNLKALSSALNAKDYYTLGHAARVAAYMVLLGEELGWEPGLLREVEEAAYLHDIGKIGVSDRVLLKPGNLNVREWELMRRHPVYSADIIRPLFSEELTAGVRHHHERYGGGGYPDGLAGDDIPLVARAMCVVDSYDAMSLRRPYRQALSYAACREELSSCAGAQFDPVIVAAFERVLARLHEDKAAAVEVARAAAERIDAAAHATLREPEDESSPIYQSVVATLREVRDEHPRTRYLTTFARRGSSTMLVADAEEDPCLHSHVGDDRFADEEILRVFGGETMDRTVLFVDQFGVWISGVSPIRDERGEIVAVVNADLPASTGATQIDGLRSDVTQTFAAMVADAAASLGHVELEAISDGLTGLYNHRYLHERLDEEIERCVLQGGSLALLLIDLDDFRAFNDHYGHSAGDRALREVAHVIESSLRQVDLAARYGGEEFAAILIDADEAGALEVAERIRNGIVHTELTLGHASLSVSIGLALCPTDASHKEELLDKADWAMFLAKRRGRDQVVSFGVEHGALTPEQAVSVHDDHVSALADVVAARAALAKRRRAAVTHLALAAARELGVDGETMHSVVVAAAAACGEGAASESGAGGPAQQLAALAAAYEALVTRPPYRPQISESEALEELRTCPPVTCDARVAEAFERVLGRPRA
jgi:diguanylate cyclase (GGDEF)-like protein/excisionase family DNA binding protein